MKRIPDRVHIAITTKRIYRRARRIGKPIGWSQARKLALGGARNGAGCNTRL